MYSVIAGSFPYIETYSFLGQNPLVVVPVPHSLRPSAWEKLGAGGSRLPLLPNPGFSLRKETVLFLQPPEFCLDLWSQVWGSPGVSAGARALSASVLGVWSHDAGLCSGGPWVVSKVGRNLSQKPGCGHPQRHLSPSSYPAGDRSWWSFSLPTSPHPLRPLLQCTVPSGSISMAEYF